MKLRNFTLFVRHYASEINLPKIADVSKSQDQRVIDVSRRVKAIQTLGWTGVDRDEVRGGN